MLNSISKRSDVKPFYAMDILAAANRLSGQGRDVVSLAVGQPGAQAPEIVRQAAIEAIANAPIGYTDALGRMYVRQTIAQHYREHYGVAVDATRIALTTGSSAAFNLAFLALAEPGGRVAIASPGYPAYRNIIKALSLEPVEIPAPKDPKLVFDVDAFLAEHKQSKIDILMLASPANPTGTVIAPSMLKDIIVVCEREGIAFISDEIYHRLNYVSDDVTALAFSDQAVVINSFSKYYCMTGWRIGWMVVPEHMVRTVERLSQNLYICPPEVSQIAAGRAFEASETLERIKAEYEKNRALLLDALPDMGVRFASQPDGAFYAWCDVSEHTNDSMEFAHRMLNEIGVAAAPGIDFDQIEGARHMRFSYAGKFEVIEDAVARMKKWLK